MSRLPGFSRAFAPGLLLALAVQANAAEDALTDPPFDIAEFRVLGNTTLPTIEVERAVYGLLGPGKTIADVETARQQLEAAYRQAGYATVFVDIPEQKVDSGVVRLRVTEGRIDRVRVAGARYFSNGQIRESLPSLESGAVPVLENVQKELTELNRRTRDRNVVPVLKAGRTPGTVDVQLNVTDELPLHGSLEVNDRYTADTSHLRVTAGLSFDNLFQRQHSLSLQFQTAPEEPDETRAIVASYTFRVPSLDNTIFALYAVDSRSDIAALGTLSVLGNGRIYGARMIRTLAATPRHFSNLSFGLDYKDFLEDIRLEADQGLVTPISYLDWSIDYTATLRSEDGARTTTFNAGANFGVRGLFNSPREFADKRFQAQANYFYVRGGVEHLQPLPAGFRLFGKLAGQLARSPLVSNEQLVLGGVETVRGYLESSHLGDYGASATVELRQGWPLALLGVPADRGYLFAFFDAGRVFVLEPLDEQTSRFSLGSYGVGLRLTGWHGLDLALDLARVLRDSGPVARGDQRLHFGFRYAF